MKHSSILFGSAAIVALSAFNPILVRADALPEAEPEPKNTSNTDLYKHEEDKVLIKDEEESEMKQTLSGNLPVELRMPGTGRFAFAGRDNKFYIAVGGYAKATVSYDFGNPVDNANEFITSAIPMTHTPGDGGLVQFSAMQSHLYLNFVAMPGSKNQLGVFIGGNFINDYNPSLQWAYLKYRGMTAGYDYSTFSDPDAGVPTIDYEGPNAFTCIPTGLVNYQASFGKNKEWTAGGGIEMPMTSITAGDGTATVNQRVPDIPAFVRYSWDGGSSYVRLSGILRNMQYRDLIANKNHNKVGWGVQLSGVANVGPNLTAYYQAVYGDGIASHIQDLDGGNMDLTPDAAAPGKMNAVKAWGAYFGLQYNFSKKVYASTTYSHVRTYAKRYNGGDTPWNDQYRYAQYAVANVFWQINPIVQTGIEYIYGRRVNYDGTQGHDNRLQCMFQVSF